MPIRIRQRRRNRDEYYRSLHLVDQEKHLRHHADLTITNLADLSLDLAEELKLLEPFGAGNEEPIFKLKNVQIDNVTRMGADRNHLRLDLRDKTGKYLKLVAFYAPEKWLNLALEHLGSEHPDYTEALILLGDLYYEKDHNDPKLYEYYHKAAIRGLSLAKCKLGLLYESGIGGVSQDENQSLYWYKSAAIDGYAPAQCSVGIYYIEKEDYEMAIPWVQKAVEQEDIGAKVLYSLCLIQIEKFPEKAFILSRNRSYQESLQGDV